MSQQRLFEFRMGERSPSALVVSEANRDAAKLLTDWRAWPSGALALVGPEGSGKTHLGLAWALEAGARQMSAQAAPEDAAAIFGAAKGRVFIDDADQSPNADMLWRVLDLSRTEAGAVLLTSQTAPRLWSTSLPDLASRLAALPVARLHEPDDALLEVILRRVCREQFIHLSDKAAKYLVERLPRTYAAARQWAAALDTGLTRGAKPVSLAGAKRALRIAEAQWGGGEG